MVWEDVKGIYIHLLCPTDHYPSHCQQFKLTGSWGFPPSGHLNHKKHGFNPKGGGGAIGGGAGGGGRPFVELGVRNEEVK